MQKEAHANMSVNVCGKQSARFHGSRTVRAFWRLRFACVAHAMPPWPGIPRPTAVLGKGTHSGTGFTISEDGLIITNDHVVSRGDLQHAALVKATFADGRTCAARLVGYDRDTDVAVLKVVPRHASRKFQALEIVDDDALITLGMPVYAVGCPLGGNIACTAGIASAQYQVADDLVISRVASHGDTHNNARTRLLQFDAQVQQGSSGSPVVNASGKVVGIASMLKAESISLAVTGSELATSVRNILGRGYVPRPYLGLGIDEVDWLEWDAHLRVVNGVAPLPPSVDRAIFVSKVVPGGPAAAAGLQVGDVITAANGVATPFKGDLFGQLGKEYVPGFKLRLEVLRPKRLSSTERTAVERAFARHMPAQGAQGTPRLTTGDSLVLASAALAVEGQSWASHFDRLTVTLSPTELPRSQPRLRR